MLLSSARRLWRLARPFQEYRGGTSHYRLYARCYSSTISGGGSKLSDRRSSVAFLGGVNNGKRKAESRPMLNAWEKKFLAGLTAYQEKSGNVLVPHAFIVPLGDESWPPTLWGYRLGRAVNVVRTRYKPQEDKKGLSTQMIEELERVGFVQNVPQFKWDHYVLPSLQTFKKLYGNTDVPYYFVVPERGESWPKLAWGKRLGLTVTVMRVGRAYASQMAGSKEELEKLEFCFSTIAERDWTEKILPSFRIHQQEFGHCIVGRGFKVPSCHPWPTKAWGMSLGAVVNDVRTRTAYVELAARDKDILATLGFAWNRGEAAWNQQIIPGIRVYAEVFKNCKIPYRFVVPSEEAWPRSAWGMKLGRVLNNMRYTGSYWRYFGRDADLLDALGGQLETVGSSVAEAYCSAARYLRNGEW